MAEQLFVSRSTLSKYIPGVKLILEAKGDRAFLRSPHYGYFIEGNERDIRNYMVSILFSGEDLAAAEPELLQVLPPLDLEQLREKVTAVLSENDLKLPERNLNNLLCYLAVGIVRIQNDRQIKFERKSALKVDKKTYCICEELLSYLEDSCRLRFGEQEKRYLAYLLIGSSYRGGEIPSDGQMNVFFEEMTDEMLFRIQEVYDVDFSTDEILRKGLIQHIYSAFHRFQLHISVGNPPLISLIKSQYIEAYNYSVLCCSILQDSYYFNITEDDIGYVALHFAAAMERSGESEHYRVIAVCGGGFGTYNFLRAKLSRYLPNIAIIDICSSFEINNHDLTDIDFIIHMTAPNYPSDLTLPAHHSGRVPVVTVNELLTEDDIAVITDCINYFNDFAYLQSLFREELFLAGLEVESKREALEQITNIMLREGHITADTKEAIFKREKVSTTEINELVAIPHSILPLELQSVIGVAILKEPPLEWGPWPSPVDFGRRN